MAVPNYTYLNLKMLGPCKVITISTSFQRAYKCEVECYEHTTAIVTSIELAAIREIIKGAPDLSGRSGLLSPRRAPRTSS